MELKKNSCEEKLQITQVSYSFPFFMYLNSVTCAGRVCSCRLHVCYALAWIWRIGVHVVDMRGLYLEWRNRKR
jgi:hypothetical protein